MAIKRSANLKFFFRRQVIAGTTKQTSFWITATETSELHLLGNTEMSLTNYWFAFYYFMCSYRTAVVWFDTLDIFLKSNKHY